MAIAKSSGASRLTCIDSQSAPGFPLTDLILVAKHDNVRHSFLCRKLDNTLDFERAPTFNIASMTTVLTIQETSATTGLSVHTLRYYERIGLIHPISRSTSRHRRYREEDLRWIEFLLRLRATGMPIQA